jgi:hypothetical protein
MGKKQGKINIKNILFDIFASPKIKQSDSVLNLPHHFYDHSWIKFYDLVPRQYTQDAGKH